MIVAHYFSSPTCGPCKTIKSSIEELQEEFEQVSWICTNTHDDKEKLAEKYEVKLVPTIVIEVFDDNRVLHSEKYTGSSIATYYRIIRNAIKFKP
jgi:thiol-disulfide isomerase/thioredoxin